MNPITILGLATVFLYSLIQIVFILISFRSLVKSNNALHLNAMESIINKILHLGISLTTQFIPIPFFYNFIHFIFYILEYLNLFII